MICLFVVYKSGLSIEYELPEHLAFEISTAFGYYILNASPEKTHGYMSKAWQENKKRGRISLIFDDISSMYINN